MNINSVTVMVRFDSIDQKENEIVVHFKNTKGGLIVGKSLVGEIKEVKEGNSLALNYGQ